MINFMDTTKKTDTLVINEIFHSIQGESSYAGQRCVFIRLTYCNIRCTYCDTEYAFNNGEEKSIDEILKLVKEYNCPLIEVTGGEPLFQPNVHELLAALCNEGYEVLLETGGSLPIEKVDRRVRKIVDIKCPSSGMMKKNHWENANSFAHSDEVKFVIGNREDYDWAKKQITEYRLTEKCDVLMSAVFGALEPVEIAKWILEDRLNVRFQLQMHKYIWHPETRGV